MMSVGSWQVSLNQCLGAWTAQQNRLPRIAILGIGNPLRSDDAAGVLIARKLEQSRLTRGLDSVLIVDAGHAPENRTAELRRFRPELVILIDAAATGGAPGKIRWIDFHEMDGMCASTHTLPLSILAEYLTLELGCEVKLLGIQPRSNEVGGSVSREILQSVDEIVAELSKSLAAKATTGPIP